MIRRLALALVAVLPLATLAQPVGDPTPDWVAVGAGTGDAAVLAVDGAYGAILTPGLVAAAGTFDGTLRFGSLAVDVAGSHADAFVVAFDLAGSPLWLRRLATLGFEAVASAVAVASYDYRQPAEEGAVYVAGWSVGPLTLDGGAAPDVTLPQGGINTGFVAKYSPAGDLVWAQPILAPGGSVLPQSLAWTVDGVVVGGAFAGTATWGDGPTRTSVGDGTDGFLASYAPDGTVARVDALGGPGEDAVTAVNLRSSTGWAVGTFRETAIVGDSTLVSQGGADVFALRTGYDVAPGAVWSVGGPGDETAAGAQPAEGHTSIGTIVGTFGGTLVVAADTLVSDGPSDLFVAVVDDSPFGSGPPVVVGAFRAGGPGADRATDAASLTYWGGDAGADIPLVVGVTSGDVTLEPPYQEPVVRAGRGATDGLAFSGSGAGWGSLYAASVVGGAGADRALAAGSACIGDYTCDLAFVGGAFEQEATFGTMTVGGTAAGDGDAFVAFYGRDAFAPFYVATAPSPEAAARLAVGPNPTRGAATVALALAAPADVAVAVVDALGRRLAALHDGPLAGGTTRWALPASLAPGVYAVRVTGGVLATATVVVVR